MKKTITIIAIGILIALLFSIFDKKPIDEIELTDNLDELIPPINIDKEQINSVDFARCDEMDSFKIISGVESGKLTVKDKTDSSCMAEVVYGIEGGYYINDCEVPFSVGTIEFTENNFDAISQYCHIRTSGEGLLELQ